VNRTYTGGNVDDLLKTDISESSIDDIGWETEDWRMRTHISTSYLGKRWGLDTHIVERSD